MPQLRLPFLLYSYVAAELLAPFFASFIILYGVFFLVRLIPLLEIVLDLGISFSDFIRLFSYIFPHMLLYVIPMASMTGVIIGFTRLTNDREILALKACGISLRQMLPPIILIAAAIASLTGFFSVSLIPAGELAVKKLMFQLAKEKIDKGLKEKSFTEALGDLVVYVDHIDENKKWHGVFVSDMRNRQQPIITIAKGGFMEAEVEQMMVTIILNDGTLHNAEEGDNQVIRFKRYQLQIPLKPPTRFDGEDVTQLSKGDMTQQQLLQRAENESNEKTRRSFLTEYHHRLVLPVGCFILSLIGLPLGLQAGPGKRAAGIPLGLAVFVLYYITFTIGRVLCEDMVVPLLVGMWMPNVLFMLLALYLFHRVDRERPILSERTQNFLASSWEIYLKPGWKILLEYCNRMISRRGSQKVTLPVETTSRLTIHANTEDLVYHIPGCKNYDCEHCRIEFKDTTIAEEAGFKPCPLCKQ